MPETGDGTVKKGNFILLHNVYSEKFFWVNHLQITEIYSNDDGGSSIYTSASSTDRLIVTESIDEIFALIESKA